MQKLIVFSLFMVTLNLYGQNKCDTLINKTDYLKLMYIINECNLDSEAYSQKIQVLEGTVKYYSQRIQFLEDLILNRDKYTLKKCPNFKKKKKTNVGRFRYSNVTYRF
jgi:hypothetical protein